MMSTVSTVANHFGAETMDARSVRVPFVLGVSTAARPAAVEGSLGRVNQRLLAETKDFLSHGQGSTVLVTWIINPQHGCESS